MVKNDWFALLRGARVANGIGFYNPNLLVVFDWLVVYFL